MAVNWGTWDWVPSYIYTVTWRDEPAVLITRYEDGTESRRIKHNNHPKKYIEKHSVDLTTAAQMMQFFEHYSTGSILAKPCFDLKYCGDTGRDTTNSGNDSTGPINLDGAHGLSNGTIVQLDDSNGFAWYGVIASSTSNTITLDREIDWGSGVDLLYYLTTGKRSVRFAKAPQFRRIANNRVHVTVEFVEPA